MKRPNAFKVQGYVTHVKGWNIKVNYISTRLCVNNHGSFFFYLNIFDFRNMTTFGNIRRFLATTVSKPCFTFTSFIWLFGAFILLNCPRVSTFRLWLHQFWYWRLLVFYTGCLLFGPRLMSDSLSFDPMSRSDWDVTYIFIVIRHVSCRFACYHITILF